MNNRFLGGLRGRLVLFVLIAIIPALAFIYYNAHRQRAAAVDQAEEDVARITRLVAADCGRTVEGAHELLIALAALPGVRSGDPAQCSDSLGNLMQRYDVYSNLGVAGLGGNIICSAVPLNPPASVANLRWFKDAIASRDFAVGDYQVGGVSARPSVSVGYPLLGDNGQVQGVVFAALDLARLSRLLMHVQAPEGVELAMVDRNGLIIAHAPTADDPVGKLSTQAERIKDVALFNGRGTDEGQDAAGVERIYAYYPVSGRNAKVEMYATATVPRAVALANADWELKKNLIGLAAVSLVALLAAWYGGETILLRQTKEELEERVRERTRELEHEQFLLRTLLDNVPDSIYFKDSKGRFLRSSRAQAQRFGLRDPAQAVGKTDFDFFSKEHAEEAFADEQRIIQTGQPVIGVEELSPLADGAERWVSTSKLPLRDKDGTVIGTFGISRDITERKRAEKTLAQERNVLQTLVDHLPSLVFIKDTRGRYVFDNAAHRAFMGVGTLEDLVGKTVFDFYPQDTAAPIHADDLSVLASETPVLYREDTLIDYKGRKLRASTSKIPYRDERRRIVGLVCIYDFLSPQK
ncbi:MAG TPA: PAS domain-containing protein [Verrucomicrobiae bacterium]|nr:PAS domain-containing protein [Verrucomicrobiae bacterium]